MLTLLRDLRHLRRQIALPAPARGRSLAIRHVDAGSCNGCEHELTLTQVPTTTCSATASASSPPPATPTSCSSPAPSPPACATPLLTAYDAMPEPRLVAALGDCALGCNLLGTPESLADPSPASFPSTSASPAAHPRPKRSPKRSSNSSIPNNPPPKNALAANRDRDRQPPSQHRRARRRIGGRPPGWRRSVVSTERPYRDPLMRPTQRPGSVPPCTGL